MTRPCVVAVAYCTVYLEHARVYGSSCKILLLLLACVAAVLSGNEFGQNNAGNLSRTGCNTLHSRRKCNISSTGSWLSSPTHCSASHNTHIRWLLGTPVKRPVWIAKLCHPSLSRLMHCPCRNERRPHLTCGGGTDPDRTHATYVATITWSLVHAGSLGSTWLATHWVMPASHLR